METFQTTKWWKLQCTTTIILQFSPVSVVVVLSIFFTFVCLWIAILFSFDIGSFVNVQSSMCLAIFTRLICCHPFGECVRCLPSRLLIDCCHCVPYTLTLYLCEYGRRSQSAFKRDACMAWIESTSGIANTYLHRITKSYIHSTTCVRSLISAQCECTLCTHQTMSEIVVRLVNLQHRQRRRVSTKMNKCPWKAFWIWT